MNGNKSGALARTSISNFLKGFLMGGADIIPGVSGGTMALIVGIYERLIDSITQLYSFAIALVTFRIEEAKKTFNQIEWSLLIPLGAGIGSAIFMLAHLITHFLTNYPVECRGLFFGLIAASLAIPWLRAKEKGPGKLLIATLACVFAFFSSGLAPQEITNPSMLHIFGAAAVAICAMILPGVSGSFLLLVLGLYAPTTEAIKSLDLGYIAVFGAGAVVGMGAFSRFLKWLLANHHDSTMAALIGLMAGSLRALWPWQTEERVLQAPMEGDPFGVVILLAVIGFIAVISLVVWEHRRQKPEVTQGISG